MYVVDIRPEERQVVIGSSDELAGHRVDLEELNWLGTPLQTGDECMVQIRYRSRALPATVMARGDDSLSLALQQPATAISPGQSGVLYGGDDGSLVLGGGVIA